MILLRAGRVQIEQNNFCPAYASRAAIARPIPLAAPVTPTPLSRSNVNQLASVAHMMQLFAKSASRPGVHPRKELRSNRLSGCPTCRLYTSCRGGAVPCALRGLTSPDLLRWRQLRSFARWGRRLPGQIRVLSCQLLFTQPPIDLF